MHNFLFSDLAPFSVVENLSLSRLILLVAERLNFKKLLDFTSFFNDPLRIFRRVVLTHNIY